MNTLRYAIYEISALSILSSQSEIPSLIISEENKEYMTETIYQENCAMFNQIMTVLRMPTINVGICENLINHLVCIDFEGVFDRPSYGKARRLQEKAANMFSPDGIRLDLGQGFETFVSFERSASMSRRSRIYFIRKDIADKVYKRVTLGMDIGKCQLSKLYAYNGLLFTGGIEIESKDFLNDKSIIIIDNPETVVPNIPIITVEDDGTNNPVRKYHRVERITDVNVEEFDGEGLVSSELARKMDGSEKHLHHSFQIRLPYIKGVVHEVNYKDLFSELGVTEIVDIFGVKHSVSEVDLILTKSMFKGFGWMTDNGLSWSEYLNRCLQYGYNLFISGQDQEDNDQLIELNYQLLNTAAVSQDTFRPKSLPFAWNHSPAEEKEEWLTKATETEHYKLSHERDGRISYFLKDLRNSSLGIVDRRRKRAELLQKNSKYINEPVFTKELSDMADRLLQKYSIGKLLIAGDNRYLSDDLMRLLAVLVKPTSLGAYNVLLSECLTENEIYAPKPSYQEQETYTLLRNPHISRNEEAIVKPIKNIDIYREKYLSHLHYVVMVDSRSLIPDRLGGADYDGDLVKTVADPLLNSCIAKDLPLLKIPTATPLIQDANKWQDRFFVIKSTFSSRVGQISNAAFRRSVIAYNENTNDENREKLRQETEILAILTGLEIDSAKSGIKPDLTEYLDTRRTNNAFLTFKNMVSAPQDLKSDLKTRLKWYFELVDWDKISSNIELLPLYGKLMSEGTKLTNIKPATDEELFTFASDPNWKDNLDKDLLERMRGIISDYEEAKQRVRYFRHDNIVMRRQKDIRRILFMQNKEEEHTVDELYHAFDYMTPYKIKKMRKHLEESNWLFTKPEDREAVMFPYSDGYVQHYTDVFCDFSHNGYRILTDILADIDEMYDKKAFHDRKAVKSGDTKQMKWMLNGLTDAEDYEQRLIENCIYVLSPPDRNAKRIDFKDAVKCAVALDKRQFAMEVLPAVMLDLTIPEQKEKPKKRWFRR